MSSRGLARATVTIEALTAVILLVGVPLGRYLLPAVVSALLFSLFLVVVIVARRKGAPCNCFGVLSRRPAGAGELVRSFVFLIAALALVPVAANRPDSLGPTLTFEASVGFALLVLAAALPSVAGRRLSGQRGDESAEQVDGQSRRSFLHLAMASVVALFALFAGVASRPPAARADGLPGFCDNEYSGCVDCCGHTSCLDCCGICFEMCMNSNSCARADCFGCWPGNPC